MREQNKTTPPQEVWQLLRELIETQKETRPVPPTARCLTPTAHSVILSMTPHRTLG